MKFASRRGTTYTCRTASAQQNPSWKDTNYHLFVLQGRLLIITMHEFPRRTAYMYVVHQFREQLEDTVTNPEKVYAIRT